MRPRDFLAPHREADFSEVHAVEPARQADERRVATAPHVPDDSLGGALG